MPSRRDFLRYAGLGALWPRAAAAQDKPKPEPEAEGIIVNDAHSGLSSTSVSQVLTPSSLDEVRAAMKLAREEERAVCIAGARHGMGQQGFATDGILLDTRKMSRVVSFDTARGLIEVEAGMQWPQLARELDVAQRGAFESWTYAQKQADVDGVTIGGSLAANIHGRGLAMPPFVADIEAFRLLNARGELLRCSREENPELFALAIGGYGLFGFVHSVTLRLVPRRRLQRIVEERGVEGLGRALSERIIEGYVYGHFEMSVDESSPDFLDRGVFTCYRPVAPDMPLAALARRMSVPERRELLYLAHTNRADAYRRYARRQLSTHEDVVWSDEQQMSAYPERYHRDVNRRTGTFGTDVMTELYCERIALELFIAELRAYAKREGIQFVSAAVRVIEPDTETFLAWARRPFACLALNMHVERGSRGLIEAGDRLRRLIDVALRYGGSYSLAYHRHAIRRQLLAAYPQFPRFLRLKRKYDPGELFQSDWYRHYKNMVER